MKKVQKGIILGDENGNLGDENSKIGDFFAPWNWIFNAFLAVIGTLIGDSNFRQSFFAEWMLL